MIEGMHLRNLLVNHLHQSSPVPFYLIIGWGGPLIFAILWSGFKFVFDNHLCWAVEHHFISLIVEVPKMALVLINLYFFLHVIYIIKRKITLITRKNFEKMVRSFLLLVPLLGMHYLITKFIIVRNQLTWIFIIREILEAVLCGLQGIGISIVYCFNNEDVKNQVLNRKRQFKERKTLYQDAKRRSTMHNLKRDSDSSGHKKLGALLSVDSTL